MIFNINCWAIRRTKILVLPIILALLSNATYSADTNYDFTLSAIACDENLAKEAFKRGERLIYSPYGGPIVKAISHRCTKVLKVLLNNCPFVEKLNEETPLIIELLLGQNFSERIGEEPKILEIILRAGIDPNKFNSTVPHENIVSALSTFPTMGGKKLFEKSEKLGQSIHVELLKILVEYGFSIDQASSKGHDLREIGAFLENEEWAKYIDFKKNEKK